MVLVVSLTGCAARLSGITGGSYTCKAPQGSACDSVSGNYARALDQKHPGQSSAMMEQESAPKPSQDVGLPRTASAATWPNANNAFNDPPTGGLPVRSAPRVLRIWLAPREDGDGVFHDQRFVYAVVENGLWQTERALFQLEQAPRLTSLPAVEPVGEASPRVSPRTETATMAIPMLRSRVAPELPPVIPAPSVVPPQRVTNQVDGSTLESVSKSEAAPTVVTPARPRAIIRPLAPASDKGDTSKDVKR
jgi:conjugal transfer pilus assembly protein TraV